MKKIISRLLVIITIFSTINLQAEGRRTDADVDTIKSRIGDPTATSPVITDVSTGIASILNSVGSDNTIAGGTTATARSVASAGTYALGDDLTTSAAVNAIEITASGVVVDLRGHTVDGDSTGTNGITIANSLSNITIKNGRITNFDTDLIDIGTGCSNITLEDIEIDGETNSVIGIDVGAGGSNITLRNVFITRTTDDAIEFGTAAGSSMTDSLFENVHITSCTGTEVIDLNECIKIKMVNCRINDNSSTASQIAISLDTVTQSYFKDVQIISNAASPAGAFTGFDLTTATACVENLFEGCSIRSNSATGGDFTGFKIDTSSLDNVFKNCDVIANTSDFATYGFHTLGTDANNRNNARNTFISCLAHKNTSTGAATNAFGFRFLNSDDNHCIRCIASDNQASGTTGAARGFEIKDSKYCTVEECSSVRNVNTSTTNPSVRSFGYHQDPTSAGSTSGATGLNVFIKNIALANGTGATGIVSIGSQYSGFDETQVSVDGINTDLGGAWHNVALTGNIVQYIDIFYKEGHIMWPSLF